MKIKVFNYKVYAYRKNHVFTMFITKKANYKPNWHKISTIAEKTLISIICLSTIPLVMLVVKKLIEN